jgi:hypothetical protein
VRKLYKGKVEGFHYALSRGCWSTESGVGLMGSQPFCDWLRVPIWLSLTDLTLEVEIKIREAVIY